MQSGQCAARCLAGNKEPEGGIWFFVVQWCLYKHGKVLHQCKYPVTLLPIMAHQSNLCLISGGKSFCKLRAMGRLPKRMPKKKEPKEGICFFVVSWRIYKHTQVLHQCIKYPITLLPSIAPEFSLCSISADESLLQGNAPVALPGNKEPRRRYVVVCSAVACV